VIERVIENWLDNTTEREYELAFCQVLVSKRYKIVSKSSHGPGEHGKDLICMDPLGWYRAYQLKTGNINLQSWRKIRGEIEELVELPIEHPNIPNESQFVPYLVTNGQITSDVRHQIVQYNATWHRRCGRQLELIERGPLLQDFLELHKTLLPVEPVDFERFLRLFLADRFEFLDKPQFSKFVEKLLPLDEAVPRAKLSRVFSSAAVLAAYVLGSYGRARNHHAQAEGWVLTIGHLLLLAEYFPTYKDIWNRTLALCLEAWEDSVSELSKEALSSTDWAEGDFLTDSLVISYRSVILAGYLSAYALLLKKKERDRELRDTIYLRVRRCVLEQKLFFWGESASPYFYAVLMLLQSRGDEGLACNLAASLISRITHENKLGARPGTPDPYCTPDELTRQFVFEEDIFPDNLSFGGRSYSLKIFVEFLARRERKQSLRRLWYGISGVDQAEFVPKVARDIFRWKNKDGTLVTRRWKQPQDWQELYDNASAIPARANLLAGNFPEFLLPFAMVYPHRFNADMAKLIEESFL
jgi:hypothetical protein